MLCAKDRQEAVPVLARRVGSTVVQWNAGPQEAAGRECLPILGRAFADNLVVFSFDHHMNSSF